MQTDVRPVIGVGAVILNTDNEILLLLRKKHPEANKWSIPGGKLDTFELLQDAVIREVKEEVNLDVTVDEMLCTAETIDVNRQEHWISIIYVATIQAGTPVNMEPDKIEAVEWFSLEDLPENIACFSLPAIELLKKHFYSAIEDCGA